METERFFELLDDRAKMHAEKNKSNKMLIDKEYIELVVSNIQEQRY